MSDRVNPEKYDGLLLQASHIMDYDASSGTQTLEYKTTITSTNKERE